jgi:hypothetical protein
VRHSTVALRARRKTASSVAAAALTIGLGISGIATATPVGAGETIKTELHKLRICESGNNYRENTGNGYFGAYQFSRSTWHGIGFHGRPDQARHVRQDRAAKRLHAQSGWGAWPSCAQREHLR